MKSKFYILVVLIILLSLSFTASADNESYIVKLNTTTPPTTLTSLLKEVNAEHGIYTIDCPDKLADYNEYIEYIDKNQELTLIEGIEAISLYSVPEDEYYSSQWQSDMVNAEFAWGMETYGNEVNVAVIDTGCNSHEDLVPAGGYNFVLNNDDYSDNHGHGTHVSGIISAQHNTIGIAGIAPKVNIYALKCVDPDYYSDTDELVAAIYAAVDDYNCKVISLSLGVTSSTTALYDAVKHATGKGAIIIAAAGNDGASSSSKSRLWYPAAYDEVIGVGSVSKTKQRSSFSQQNDTVFVVAPGENYKSTTGTNNYTTMTGTSQSTPVVAAAAAILFAADNDMTLADFKNYIIASSEALADDYCGYGLLNIEALFKECIKNTSYYISPINSDGVVVYNNTDTSLTATGILAEYEGEKFASYSASDIVLSAYEKIKIPGSSTGLTQKFFLWEKSDKLTPLTKVKFTK